MSGRRAYVLSLTVNGRRVSEVVIDPHYETKHPDISDALILELVQELDGKEVLPDERDGEWEFFMLDRIENQGKQYRLIWCMRDECRFIGVINCFRR
jgi:hypothetical protein